MEASSWYGEQKTRVTTDQLPSTRHVTYYFAYSGVLVPQTAVVERWLVDALGAPPRVDDLGSVIYLCSAGQCLLDKDNAGEPAVRLNRFPHKPLTKRSHPGTHALFVIEEHFPRGAGDS